MARQKQVEQPQPRRKFSQLDKAELDFVDYKDTQIKPRRVTGICTQHQHNVAMAIKRAREMALLPYTVTVVSSRGGRNRG